MTTHEVYRHGELHVMADKCSSCIFRPVSDGRIRGLAPGRVGEMVQEARANDSVIPCHQTIHVEDEQPAVCHGYFATSKKLVTGLRLAVALGIVKWVEPEKKS